jgi:hypothetical protein
MIDGLRLRRRWVPPGLAAILGLLYLPLGWAALGAVFHPESFGPGIRLFLPFFAILTYLVAALTANHRQARVQPSGVEIRLRPFPLGNGRTVPREAIACCYHRQIIDYAKGHAISTHYTMGIQTRDAEMLDLLGLCPTEAEAATAAAQTAQILSTASPIEVRPPALAKPRRPSLLAFFLWVALTLLSIAAGAAWEISAGTL